VQRHRYQRCWIRRIATGTSLAGLVAHDLQGEADWRCLESPCADAGAAARQRATAMTFDVTICP
jgi:hypothetical protein